MTLFRRTVFWLAIAGLALPAFAQVRIDCGSWPSNYVDSTGATWLTDRYYQGGDAYYTSNGVNSPDALLYRTNRYGLWGNFSYSIPVANGTYQVTLKFSELVMSGKGQRVFNVIANNATVLSGFDVLAAAGGMYIPIDKSFPVTVTNGLVNLQFVGTVNLPMVSAIAVVPSGSAPATSPVTLTVSPTSGSVVSGGTLQFAASSGASWSASAGSINSSGLYTAPSAVLSNLSVTITATSTTSSSVTAQASITVTPAPPVVVSLTVSPTSGTVTSGQTLQLSASGPATWSTSAGLVSSTGLFTAPSVTTSTPVTVVATSSINSSVTSKASITVTPIVSSSTPSSNGPVGYWTFDTAKISGSQILDSSGNNLTGTSNSGVSSVTGVVNQAAAFNGITGDITFPLDSFTDLDTNLTLAAWIKTSNATRTEAILARYNAAGTETGYVFRTDSGGHVEMLIGGHSNSSGGQKLAIDTGKKVNDGQWHHVAATLTLGQGISFYIDGQISSTTGLGLLSAVSGSRFSIGVNGWTPYGTYFTGDIDEAQVFNRSLAASEIATLAHTTVGAPPPQTLSASPTSLSYSAPTNSTAAGQTLSITSATPGLSWTANASSWVTLSATSGITPATITVGANTSGLIGGNNYTGSVTVSASGLPSQSTQINLAVTQTTTTPPVTPPTGGSQWYVSPSGSPSGNGSITSPWDLTTALKQPAPVHPGDTIWLRGGMYSASPVAYTSSLTGTASQPIVIKQYPGERATVNGNIAIYAPYTWYWGFEVTNTSGARGAGEALLECMDTYPGSAGVKLINLILHDCDQGIGFWVDATDAEANGNVIYYVGQSGPTRGEGHAIYTQNQTGTKHIIDNIMFDAFDIGLQGYGSGAAYVQNYDLNGNVSFNNGALYGSHVDNILFAGGQGLNNISVQNSYTYHTPSLNQGYSRLGWQFGGTNGSLTMNNNYWIGGEQAVQVWDFQHATASGNVFYSQGSLMLMLIGGSLGTSGYSWDNNHYYGSGLLNLNNSNYGFSSWSSTAGIDSHSSFNPGRPTGTWTFVRPNAYDAGRANIIIYNWNLATSVSVDLSGVLHPGDSYIVHDVFNYFGTPVASGVYSGSPVSIPMTPGPVSQPIGGVPVPPTHTLPEFGTFVVTKQ